MLYPVILSGGFGGRLWPISRVNKPKQFLPLLTDKTLLQETLLRLVGLPHIAPPSLVCNEQHRFIMAEQVRALGISPRRLFLEPVGRNTAPAIAITALDIAEQDPNGLLLVLPSDHLILNTQRFHQAIQQASLLAQSEKLVTFGIIPTAPKTGYGYIQQGNCLTAEGYPHAYKVAAFVEKPSLEKAEDYLKQGDYHWNSGIFLFKATTFLRELQNHAPEIYQACLNTHQRIRHEHDFSWMEAECFEKCPDLSIDYAVMEKTTQAVVLPVDMGWSDIGSWGALWEVLSKDPAGNALSGNIYLKDVYNCYIRSNREIVAALGIDDLIIVDTDDALFIAHKSKEQDVKNVFKKLM